MPQKVLKFTGINRKVNEYQNSGACEELINLRPMPNNTEVIRPKKIVFANTEYDVYNHSFADESLFIGIVRKTKLEICIIHEDESVTPIDSLDWDNNYRVAFVGNMMVLSNDSEIKAYSYVNGEYTRVEAVVPDDIQVKAKVDVGYGYHGNTSKTYAEITSNAEFDADLMTNWSSAVSRNGRANEIFGPVVIAFNYELEDGTEFWTNKWIYLNPFLNHAVYNREDGREKIYYYNTSSGGAFIFDSYKVDITISKQQMSKDGVKNLVRNVNVYASRPVFPYDINDKTYGSEAHNTEVWAKVYNIAESGVTNQQLYFQQSIPVSQIEKEDVSVKLNFKAAQIGERILNIDNGPTKRVGDMVSMNNRIHFFNSSVSLFPQSVTCWSEASVQYKLYEERNAYVHLECNDSTVVLKTKALFPKNNAVQSPITELKMLSCCYPDARAKKILIECPELSAYSTINLTASSSHNFAFGESVYPNQIEYIEDIHETSNIIHESNTINISSQYNPFVLPVKYSYSVGGKILDLTTSYLPISATQIGQYPLTVFTSNGIFVMEQGSGDVLYSNVVPVQPQVISGKAKSSPYGTFFVSSNNLYVLSGREATNVSYALNGDRELNIRGSKAYKSLCCDATGPLHDFTSLLSNEDFNEFIHDVVLTYDQLNNELYISSKKPEIGYSYVFNLDTKVYHKVNKRYLESSNGARYVIEIGDGVRNVVDLHTEIDSSVQPILLQSRPFSLEMLYTHIQRLQMFVDAKLGEGQNLCLSVFGSDNLYDWKCIISAQKQDTVLRQITTNRAAKSYKDYVILINGTVSTDTDLSDIIADYTVVSRRIG